MPIRAEHRHLYLDPIWLQSVGLARRRANDRCEQCRRPGYGRLFVYTWKTREPQFCGLWVAHMVWVPWSFPQGQGLDQHWRDQFGRPVPREQWPRPGLPRSIWAQIGAAHVDGNPRNMEPANCKMLCNWCHLHHDQQQHHEARADRKDRRRPLIADASIDWSCGG